MELMIVVAVIVVLAAIALPTFQNAKIRSGQDADIQAVSALYTEMQAEYEIKGTLGTKSVETPMNEAYDSENPRAKELAGLKNAGWNKGSIVSITSQKNGNDVEYTISCG